MAKDSHLRSILKGISWRIIATTTTTTIAWLATGDVSTALTIGGFEFLIKLGVYYLHERVWLLVPEGGVRQIFRLKEIRQMAANIHPVHDRMLNRHEREQHHKQHSVALWFTGLSGSGKSTIAIELEHRLFAEGYCAQLLDGDNIRSGINANLTFTAEDRRENIRRIAEVSKLFVHAGIITLNTFISPTREMREMARDIIGDEDFVEIFINTPIEVCEQRDVKGLYAKARKGEIKNFTGIDAPYEAPENPQIEIHTTEKTVEACVNELMAKILPRIQFNYR